MLCRITVAIFIISAPLLCINKFKLECSDLGINFLLSNNNLIAKHLGANEKNYEKIIRGYFFIGVIECFDESISKLEKITQINFTIDNKKKNISKKYFLKSDLSDEIISRFMIKNVLDYKIYNLAKHLLKE